MYNVRCTTYNIQYTKFIYIGSFKILDYPTILTYCTQQLYNYLQPIQIHILGLEKQYSVHKFIFMYKLTELPWKNITIHRPYKDHACNTISNITLHYTPNIRSWNIEDCAPWEFCQTGACYACQNSLGKTWELHLLLNILHILYHLQKCYGCQNSLGKNRRIAPSATYSLWAPSAGLNVAKHHYYWSTTTHFFSFHSAHAKVLQN